MEIRLWIVFLVDFEKNYVTLCTSINFIRNWKSVGGESTWLNRALIFYFNYVRRVLDANCLYKKFKIGRLLAVSLGSLDFVYLFLISGTTKWFFRLQFKQDLPYAGHFSLGLEPLQSLHLLIIFFDFLLGAWWRGLRSLLILWRLAADWDWRISRAWVRVSSAACPALMVLKKVRLDSLKSLSWKALLLVPQTIISLMRESRKFSNSHSALNFFSTVMKSWKLWSSSCLYVKNFYDGEWWHFSLGCSTQKIYSKQILISFHHQLNRR